jgi:hypothetical protein
VDAKERPAVGAAAEAAPEAVEAQAEPDAPDVEAVVLGTVEAVVEPAAEPVVEVAFNNAVYIVQFGHRVGGEVPY